jgi:mono/diheme cytochrome c family protein
MKTGFPHQPGRARLRASRRARLLATIALAAGVSAGAAGCRQDMHDGPRFTALQKNDFYADHRSERPLIEGTVARGQLRADDALYLGKVNGQFVTQLPAAVPVTRELLARGQDRFNIYCAPCHSKTGNGDGMVVRRGYKQPPSYHDGRLRSQPVGYFYDVITHGFGQMPDYAAQIAPKDRWAIVAYVRALQLSQHAAVADVPAADRSKLDAPAGSEEPKEGSAGHE